MFPSSVCKVTTGAGTGTYTREFLPEHKAWKPLNVRKLLDPLLNPGSYPILPPTGPTQCGDGCRTVRENKCIQYRYNRMQLPGETLVCFGTAVALPFVSQATFRVTRPLASASQHLFTLRTLNPDHRLSCGCYRPNPAGLLYRPPLGPPQCCSLGR